LSGHIGGANQLSRLVANAIGGTAIITTATDINSLFSVDTWACANDCFIKDISKIKTISGAVLRGDKVGFDSGAFDIEGDIPDQLTSGAAETGICVSLSGSMCRYHRTLELIPRIITLGIGCKKDISSAELENFILNALSGWDISIQAIEAVASIDIKQNEKCIIDLCSKYHLPFVVYTAEELQTLKGDFSGSSFVKNTTGTDNVCERSAVFHSGGTLLKQKFSKNGMTVAAAIREWTCIF